jgi:Holliday junction resolvase
MPINSRAKGCVGEREAANFLNELLGCNARRGQQFKGTPDSPDIVDAIPGVHIEVKRVEKLNILKALKKCAEDCHVEFGDKEIPMLLHRPNRAPWMVTIFAEDLILFAERILEVKNGN